MTADPSQPLAANGHLQLDVVIKHDQWPNELSDPTFAARVAAAIDKHLDMDAVETAVVALGSDADVHQLNGQYRGKNQPTNVLSFPAAPAAFPDKLATHLGDIILAFETVRREAEDKAIGIEHHTAHLMVHGILHLLGYDHEVSAAAEEMEALEIDILATLGIDNPYTEELVDQG